MFKKVMCLFLPLLLLTAVQGLTEDARPRLGVWITVFTPEKVLYSKENVDKMIDVCNSSGITDIYLQIYRADRAHYDSSLTDRSPFEEIKNESGKDTISYLLGRASEGGIKVHAWLNLMSLAHNKDANIIKKFGTTVLTFDQHGRASMGIEGKDELDKYYIRENQLFLDPGDWRVRDYMGKIAEEVITKYPDFDGIHMDYIRYPAVVPFIPGARFTSHGISYGYNNLNLLNFKKATGLDAMTMNMTRGNAAKWDEWRRSRVTLMTGYIAERVRKLAPSTEISAAVVPSLERTHLVTFQDWPEWIASGTVDSVILMNYTTDTALMKMNSVSCLSVSDRSKVQIGIGSYLLKDSWETLYEQIKIVKDLAPSGLVLFSYDELARNKELQNLLALKFGAGTERTAR